RIFTKVSHRISQVGDTGGVGGNVIRQISDIGGVVSNIAGQVGDISGVGCHVVVGGFQLRTVNGIGTGCAQCTIFYISNCAGGIGAVFCTVDFFKRVPL
ncbi:hypothetical protein CE817_13035, partial [Salmonella enterica subsp. enterica serovar Derby]|nr:hypothetical protein [Salmonella enterica subsp. enterica serovar Derby]